MAYPTTTEHSKRYPYTSIMASPYSCDPTGAIDCAAALEQIKADQSNIGTIYIPHGTFKIATNLTIPVTMHIVREAGAVFSIANGVTLTINCNIEGPISQFFSCIGTGSVAGLQFAYPQWFGTAETAPGLALSAAQEMIVPTGTVVLCLNAIVPSNKVVSGAGTLKMPNSSAVNSTILNVSSNTNIQIKDITLDGNKANQGASSTHSFIRGDGCSDIQINVAKCLGNRNTTSDTIGALHLKNAARCSVRVVLFDRYEKEGIWLENCTDSVVYDTITWGTLDPAGENTDRSASGIQASGFRNRIDNCFIGYPGASGISNDSADGMTSNSIVYRARRYNGFNFGHDNTNPNRAPDGGQAVNLTVIEAGYGGAEDCQGFQINYNTSRRFTLTNCRNWTANTRNLTVGDTGSVGLIVNGFIGTGAGAAGGAEKDGVKLYSGDYDVSNVEITGAAGNGFVTTNHHDKTIKISNSKFNSNTGYGIYTDNANNGGVVELTNVEAKLNGSDGLKDNHNCAFTIIGGNYSQNTGDGIDANTFDANLTGVKIRYNEGYGINNGNLDTFHYLNNCSIVANKLGNVRYPNWSACKIGTDNKRVFMSSAPTTGTFKDGDIWENSNKASGQPPRGNCITSGTFTNYTDAAGVTTNTSNEVSGLTAASTTLRKGHLVQIDDGAGNPKGFATIGPFRIVDWPTATTIKVDGYATSSQVAVRVLTVDPTFASEANLP